MAIGCMFAATLASSARTDSTAIRSRIMIDATGAYVPHTSRFFEGRNNEDRVIDGAAAFNLKYAFCFGQQSRQWRHYPGAYQGLGLGFNTFFAGSLMGNPVSVYVFQGAPLVHFSPRLSLGYEWNFGASFGWKKYDYYTDDQNIIGSHTNAYMNLALVLNYRLSPQWTVGVGLTGSHFSNGNTSQPNSGVNTLGLRMGVSYNIDTQPVAHPSALPGDFKRGWSLDVMAYGAWRAKVAHFDGTPVVLKGKFAVAGINIAPMYEFHRLFRAGVSVDVKYDESAGIERFRTEWSSDDNPKFYRPSFHKNLIGGLSAKAEFVMPVFTIAAGVGYNFVGPDDDRSIYQTLTLKTYLTERLYLNVGYQLHEFKTPNNLMLGLGYRFAL